MITPTLGLLCVLLTTQSTTPLPFKERPRRVGIVNGYARVVPNPKWINMPWSETEDQVYAAHEREYQKAIAQPGFEATGVWPLRFRAAMKEYLADYQNPVKLYKASATYMAAYELHPGFPSSNEDRVLHGKLNAGWEYLDKPPKSYRFARMGYFINSNDMDNHDYDNLALRLLKRKPFDREVAFAMRGEYFGRNDRQFSDPMFAILESLEKTGKFKRWDALRYAGAINLRGLRTKNRADLERAIKLAEQAAKKTPKGADDSTLRESMRIYKDSLARMR